MVDMTLESQGVWYKISNSDSTHFEYTHEQSEESSESCVISGEQGVEDFSRLLLQKSKPWCQTHQRLHQDSTAKHAKGGLY